MGLYSILWISRKWTNEQNIFSDSDSEQQALINARLKAGCSGKHVIIRYSAERNTERNRKLCGSWWMNSARSSRELWLCLDFYPRLKFDVEQGAPVIFRSVGCCHARCKLNVSPPQPDLSCRYTCKVCEVSGERNYPFPFVWQNGHDWINTAFDFDHSGWVTILLERIQPLL